MPLQNDLRCGVVSVPQHDDEHGAQARRARRDKGLGLGLNLVVFWGLLGLVVSLGLVVTAFCA